jgi:hypothetical protein
MPALDSQTAAAMAAKSAQTRRTKALERRIRELVDSAPPLTDEQRDRLALLLRGSAA